MAAWLVDGLPHLDRLFLAGSVLGLPSTFTGSPYSLTAITLADSEIVRVPRGEFLKLMGRDVSLCREAIDILSRELSFIQAALSQHDKRKRLKKEPGRKPQRTGKAVLTRRFATYT
jgi:CRP-like cAMP-binding protein